MLKRLVAAIAIVAGHGLVIVVRLVTAPRAIWAGIEPIPRQRVYFANHTSNADFPMVWAVLPGFLRRQDPAGGGLGLLAEKPAAGLFRPRRSERRADQPRPRRAATRRKTRWR